MKYNMCKITSSEEDNMTSVPYFKDEEFVLSLPKISESEVI